ncbi:MAG TPA: helix-turn-helix domain-containing protein, partial [Mycobacterium sp.]|nr:helix-turn-helix domain-containing protein [Mycobacterium sp.]
IVAAASRMFVEQGFGATTIEAVAEAAGVSRKTVFTAVGGKLDLLKVALDWAVGGDDQPLTVAQRDDMKRLMEQGDPGVLLDGCAKIMADIGVRSASLMQALEVAAGIDPAARELMEQGHGMRQQDARMIVSRLRDLNALSTHLSNAEAVDVVWLATDSALYDRLVRVRGWSTGRFAEWLADMLRRQLLR